MTREEAFKEAYEILTDFSQVSIWTNEDQRTISPADEYCGGDEGCFIADALGNIQYDTEESVINDLLDFIYSCNEVIEEITID